MYALKPVFVNQNIELPKCMYNLKPANSSFIENTQDSKNNMAKSDVELLEERQSLILKRLDELKQTLVTMRGDLKLCAKPAQPSLKSEKKPTEQKVTAQKVAQKPIDISSLKDVVINVHPSNVPYSILALKNLWKGRLNLQADVYTHSTVTDSEFSNEARDFTQKVSVAVDNNSLPTLKVVIIWKAVDTTQMLTSLSKFVPVYGEVNILRFLNRVGPSEYSYEVNNNIANLNDIVLDICYQLSKKHSAKERQYFMQLLNQRLGKNQFFNNSTLMSISDIAVSSILKKLYANNLNELPANLSTWLQKISSIAGY